MFITNLQVATVDLVDYFQVPWQQTSKQVNWPALQSFRKDRVVGVGTGAHTDVPGLSISRRRKVSDSSLIPITFPEQHQVCGVQQRDAKM